ncbi:hypothetical protein AAA799E16_00499 [Marine Group I thaumarchaeote SCGC AAA799-E16]|uniref:Uncharacterized protein n=1 Tax=Marine Group I thaumarchaeote SCGC AAA799-E16 TaxID=1502292 RepID=A0A081S774_9ARCH|nr:hypothetical protein AAA799E16_00499 [Marine Group I thaumarchaeote SCGC AAA799-E16]
MLDKSPDQILDSNLVHIQNELKEKLPNIVLCSEPFHKAEFLNKLINSVETPIIFVDMDLLYTGYIESGIIPKKDNLTVFHPTKENWKEEFTKIITKISKEKFLVIIDSFNGVYNMFEDLESAIFINSCIMLLAFLGKDVDSSIIVTAMARKKENEGWILTPRGKQIIKSAKTGVYLLKKIENNLVFRSINEDSKVFKI